MKAKGEAAGEKWLRDDDSESCLLVWTPGDVPTEDLIAREEACITLLLSPGKQTGPRTLCERLQDG